MVEHREFGGAREYRPSEERWARGDKEERPTVEKPAWLTAGIDPEPKAPSAEEVLTLEVDVSMDTASYHVSQGTVSLGKVYSWLRPVIDGGAERVYQARDMARDEVGGEHLVLDDAVAALVCGTMVAVKMEFRG